ncbi:recombinase RecD [Clostridia bacterium]|nr:recombinase RecD [Clostridia bacterium]
MGAALKTKSTTKANAVIYARFSSHGQQEQSIDGQLRDCYSYAEREGLLVVGEYIDRAISGKTDERPDFRRMIADAAKKQFQYVIVWKLDRFARNRFDSAVNKAALKKYGVKVISAMENIADNPEGLLLEGILESMAEHYSNSLSTNVKRGQRESVLKGSHVGGIAPFGFKSITIGESKKLVADENNAPIIQYVFEEYAKGVPKKKIMEELTARGVLNYNGRPLTLSCLQHALHNTKYIGKYMYGGQEVEGACDAIISEDVFNAVQERLNAVKHAPAAQKARQEYLLQGKAFCGHCGARLVGDAGTSKTGAMHFYYACGKRKKYHTCGKKNEKKDFLEWYVVEQTVEYVLTPSNIELIAASIVAEYENEFNDKRIKDLERQYKKLDNEANAAVDASLSAPAKARQKYFDKIEVLETQKADIALNLTTLRIANGHRFTQEQITAWLKQFCRGEALDDEYQRRIIDLFINSVYLYDDKMVIYYNVKGGKQVSYIDMCDDMEGINPLDGGENANLTGGGGVRISHNPPRRL